MPTGTKPVNQGCHLSSPKPGEHFPAEQLHCPAGVLVGHAGPLAAQYQFLDAQLLVFLDFVSAFVWTADDEPSFQDLLEGNVDAVGGGQLGGFKGWGHRTRRRRGN